MDMIFYLFLGATLSLAGLVAWTRTFSFAAQRPEDYAKAGPQLDLRQHLKGPIQCEGVIYGPTGRVNSRFVADMDVQWDGNVGTMTEEFVYDGSIRQSRTWTLTLGNDGSIKAEAPDVVGTGTGQLTGAGVQLNYKIKLPKESGGHVLDTTDWMYLVENGSIINRSQFRKFGVKVAELVATMRPKEV